MRVEFIRGTATLPFGECYATRALVVDRHTRVCHNSVAIGTNIEWNYFRGPSVPPIMEWDCVHALVGDWHVRGLPESVAVHSHHNHP